MDGVDELRELESQDERLARRSRRLGELDAGVASIRERAEAIDAFFAAYPEEEARRRAVADAAQGEVERRDGGVVAARSELEAAHDDEARDRARRVLARAEDHLAVARSALERDRAACNELERDARTLPAELAELERAAAAAAGEMQQDVDPAGGPAALLDWASHARAELFVAAGQVDTQRERLIREANELASMLLGEATYGSTVVQARARVEASEASAPTG